MNKRRGDFARQLPSEKSGRGAHSASLEGRMATKDEARRRQQKLAEMMAERTRRAQKPSDNSSDDSSAD